VSAGAGTRARQPSFLGKTCHLPHSMRETLSAHLTQLSPRRLLPGCTVGRTYQGAQYSRWSHPCHSHQSATPVGHGSSATEYHNAYAVDPTVYAATYTASTGASPMGQVKTPFGQRVYSAMKHIREEILNHCSTISVFLIVKYTSLLGPPVGVGRLCTRPPCSIKGRRPLEKGQGPAGDLEAEDRLIHRPKNNTTLSGRRVLRSGGPNHYKFLSVLVFLLDE